MGPPACFLLKLGRGSGFQSGWVSPAQPTGHGSVEGEVQEQGHVLSRPEPLTWNPGCGTCSHVTSCKSFPSVPRGRWRVPHSTGGGVVVTIRNGCYDTGGPVPAARSQGQLTSCEPGSNPVGTGKWRDLGGPGVDMGPLRRSRWQLFTAWSGGLQWRWCGTPRSWPPSVHQLMGAPGWAGLPGGEVSEALASPAEFKGGAKKLSNRGN